MFLLLESEEHYCPSYILDAFAFLRMTVSTSIGAGLREWGSEMQKKKKESPAGQGMRVAKAKSLEESVYLKLWGADKKSLKW